MEISKILGFLAEWVPMVVTAAAAAAAVLPYPTTQPWLAIRKAIDWAALNIGKAKNSAAP